MGKNFITATEAKRISDTTDKLISNVFKCIKNEAENGYSECDFGLGRISMTTFTRLRGELLSADFKLSFWYEEYEEDNNGFGDLIEGKIPLGIKISW